jgi:hypothetical protein
MDTARTESNAGRPAGNPCRDNMARPDPVRGRVVGMLPATAAVRVRGTLVELLIADETTPDDPLRFLLTVEGACDLSVRLVGAACRARTTKGGRASDDPLGTEGRDQ